MSDTANETGHGRVRRPSAIHLLGVGLLINLALVAYLLYRLDSQTVAAAPETPQTRVAATPAPLGTVAPATAVAFGVASLPTNAAPLVARPVTGSATPDLETMMVQLQDMQLGLQAAWEQFSQAQPAVLVATPPTYAPISTAAAPDIGGMMTEIEQLYQQMLPLDQQMQAAMQSSRPESELAAMRTQMESIHYRLSDLMARVEAARAAVTGPAAVPTGPYSMATPAPGSGVFASTEPGADQVTYQQMEQMLAGLQRLLQQMQGSGGASAPAKGVVMPTPQPGLGQSHMSGEGSLDSLVPAMNEMTVLMSGIVGMIREMGGTHGPPAFVGVGR